MPIYSQSCFFYVVPSQKRCVNVGLTQNIVELWIFESQVHFSDIINPYWNEIHVR